jgi:hypothetical protein
MAKSNDWLPGPQELAPKSDYGYAIYMGVMPPRGAMLEQAADCARRAAAWMPLFL